jgi:predicted SnoaL-like aldol condensation-catalyzing enzyme
VHQSNTHKDIAIAFLTSVAAGKVAEAFEQYVSPDFRHHNPFFAGDAASLQDAMQADANEHPEKALEVHLALQEGDRVAVFSRMRQHDSDPGFALVHIFRFEADGIVELWDVAQPVPDQSLNELGMF